MLCLALATLIVPLIATTNAPQVTFAEQPSIDQIFATYIGIHPDINIVRIASQIRESNPDRKLCHLAGPWGLKPQRETTSYNIVPQYKC